MVTDHERRAIADALVDAILDARGVPSIVLPPPRAIDNEEPPATVAAALAAASGSCAIR